MSADHLLDYDEERPQAVIYSRVSSAKQVEEGHGLDSQETRCREYAERQGYDVIRTFHEKGVSGGQLDRPSFGALIAFLRPELKFDAVEDLVGQMHRDVDVAKAELASNTGGPNAV